MDAIDLVGDDELLADFPPWIAINYLEKARITKRSEAEQFLLFLRAIEDGDAQKLRELLRAGSWNANWRAPQGSLFTFATEKTKNPQCLRELIEAGHHRTDAGTLVRLAGRAHSEMVVELVRYGARLDVRTSEGFTPLLTAVELQDVAGVRALLAAGATPDFPAVWTGPWKERTKGVTGLMIAAFSGAAEILEILLQAGAHVNETDDAGRNALDYARACRKSKF